MKHILNQDADRTIKQINSTIQMMVDNKWVSMYNKVDPVDDTNPICHISWHNHVSSRYVSAKAFSKLMQYYTILKQNSYHCLLFDGSIIRFSFEFNRNILKSENLLWWPAPYQDIPDFQQASALDYIESFITSNDWYENIKLRSPIRIDFDADNNTEKHPAAHMHIEDFMTRININKPICFNRFISFIFKNFYPDIDINFSNYDFIEYNYSKISQLTYSMSTLNI